MITSRAEVVEMPVELIFNKDESEYSYHSLNMSHERQVANHVHYRKIHDRSDKIALTDSDSNIVGKEESLVYRRKENAIKEKPYS